MLLKVDCLPNAVGKQPSIPLIYLGRKWTLNWWWWWWWDHFDFKPIISRNVTLIVGLKSSSLFWWCWTSTRVDPNSPASFGKKLSSIFITQSIVWKTIIPNSKIIRHICEKQTGSVHYFQCLLNICLVCGFALILIVNKKYHYFSLQNSGKARLCRPTWTGFEGVLPCFAFAGFGN